MTMNMVGQTGVDRGVVTDKEAKQLLRGFLNQREFHVDQIEVMHYMDSNKMSINIGFRVFKKLDGEIWKTTRKTSFSIPAPQQNPSQAVELHIDKVAQAIVDDYDRFAKEVVTVSGTEIEVCYREGCWAKCKRCGESVTLEGLQNGMGRIPTEDDEMFPPVTRTHDVERFIRAVDNSKKEAVKYYLLGGLRKMCRCRFGESKDLSTFASY